MFIEFSLEIIAQFWGFFVLKAVKKGSKTNKDENFVASKMSSRSNSFVTLGLF